MGKRGISVPKLGRHARTGQGRVRIDGRDYYCGIYGTDDCNTRYRALIAEYMAKGAVSEPARGARRGKSLEGPTVAMIAERYRDDWMRLRGEEFCKVQVDPAKTRLVAWFGNLPAAEFGPTHLREFQRRAAEQLTVRGRRITFTWLQNRLVRVVRAAFSWAACEELIHEDVSTRLNGTKLLGAGKLGLVRGKRRQLVADDVVEATLPHVASPMVRAMIQILRLTGMRPSELFRMRRAEVDQSADVWLYCPPRHKTEAHGDVRQVSIGPKAQAIIAPYLMRVGPEDLVFCPRVAVREYRDAQRAKRQSPLTPSQIARGERARANEGNGLRRAGEMFTASALNRAVARACKRAGVAAWSPYRLRHTAATSIVAEFGIDVGQAVLGHRSQETTRIYTHADPAALAAKAARRVG